MEQFGKKARQKRRNLKRRTRGSTSIRLLPLLVYLFLFCRQFISEDPAPALPSSLLRPSSRSSTSYIDADVSSLTKNPLRSVSFPVRQIPGPFYLAKYISTPAAIDALSSALLSPNEICSPLFNPEVAFVFGQMSDPHSVPALLKVLEDERGEEMVRHEGAEALGGIATDEVLPVLRTWAAKTMHPGWSGKPVWWRLSCGRYVRLTSDWAHLY